MELHLYIAGIRHISTCGTRMMMGSSASDERQPQTPPLIVLTNHYGLSIQYKCGIRMGRGQAAR